jgi:hypothetical protein
MDVRPSWSRRYWLIPKSSRRAGMFLWSSVLLIAIAGATRPLGMSSLTYPIAAAVVVAILLAGWTLGGRALRADNIDRRRLALAGGLLVVAWSVIAVFAAMGPPHLATLAENKLRYPLILMNAIAIASALLVLRDALIGAGERLFSTLSAAAILLASPLYIIFCLVQLLLYRTIERLGPDQAAVEMRSLDDLSIGILFVGVMLTYLATTAAAAAMAQTRWLGRKASRVFIGASLFALLCVAVRMTEALASSHSPMWGFKHSYALPGFILAIPAVPWIMLCLIGMVLLRRAGAEQ